nr:MAG: hypothetical protein [Microvirus sp.]
MRSNGSLYAVRDTVAQLLVGGIQLHRHEAAAIRTFGDIATMKGSVVQMHPTDFELVRLGHLDDDNQLVPDFAVIMTGAAWLATQAPATDEG